MNKIFCACSILLVFAFSASGQKAKPWTEWTQKDAQKILTDSAWAQTQSELVETSAGSAITKTQGRNEAQMVSSEASRNQESGETVGKRDVAASLNYRVSFLSAKPIRQAFIRMIELQAPETPAEKVAQRRTFIDRDFGDYVVVTVIVDGTDKKRVGPAMQEITSADPSVLKATTYLERKDGKRVSLIDYRAPIQDGLGAKFVFPRTVDGKPLIEAGSGELRFVSEIGKTVKINRRFKVSEMTYDGKLEY